MSIEILHESLAGEHACSLAPLNLADGIGLWCDNDRRRPGRPAGAPRRASYPHHLRGRVPSAAAWPLGPVTRASPKIRVDITATRWRRGYMMVYRATGEEACIRLPG